MGRGMGGGSHAGAGGIGGTAGAALPPCALSSARPAPPSPRHAAPLRPPPNPRQPKPGKPPALHDLECAHLLLLGGPKLEAAAAESRHTVDGYFASILGLLASGARPVCGGSQS